MRKKYTIEEARKIFKEVGYELIEKEYKDVETNMRFICPKHGEQKMRLSSILRGSICKKCSSERQAKRQKHSLKTVVKTIESMGYKMIDDKYINSDTKIKCLCPKHGIFYARYRHLQAGHGCKKCGFDKMRGEGNPAWTGGKWKSDLMFRHELTPWVQECLKNANYRCEITGKKGNLNVHHMYSFKKILLYTLEELNIEYKNVFGDYSQEEREKIFKRLDYNNRKMAQPVVMLKSIHKKFHKFCGGFTRETSFEQLEEFKRLIKEGVIDV